LKKILLISDTHGYIDDIILKYAKEADLTIHAGDIGDIVVLDKLSKVSNLRAVYGNIDSVEIRSCTNENELLIIEGLKILITHIAGKQPRYNSRVRNLIERESPNILIYGHSHILKVENDKKNDILCVNPGAAGKHGFHKKRTMIRFNLINKQIENMEIIEIGDRSSLP
tara:strand:+ start:60 stop:566 length:507 start_codon:yes stop_codon:yes gene_type:complete